MHHQTNQDLNLLDWHFNVSKCFKDLKLILKPKTIHEDNEHVLPIMQEIMVRTYLWPIIWMKPVVFNCRKMSGMTSARLSTHSKQCVFKLPCNFGRRKNTWLTNLKIFKWSCSYSKTWVRKLPSSLESGQRQFYTVKPLNVFIYEMIYITRKNLKQSSTRNSPVHKWRKVLRHFIQANYELVIHVFFLQICYLICSKTEKFLRKLRQE